MEMISFLKKLGVMELFEREEQEDETQGRN